MKRIICLVIAALFMLMAFTGCIENHPGDLDDNDETTDDAATNDKLSIAVSELSEYTLVRSEYASDTIKSCVSRFVDSVEDSCGIKLTPRDDFFKENVASLAMGEFEILLGTTNREESRTFLSGLKRDEYGYRIIGKKLVIAGHTDEGTIAAVNKFLSDGICKGEEGVFFANINAYLYNVEYNVDSIKINGTDIGEYKIVYPNKNMLSEKAVALKIRDAIADLCGRFLSVTSDSEPIGEYEIIVGDSSHVTSTMKAGLPALKPEEFYIGSENKLIWLQATGAMGIIAAAEKLENEITPAAGVKAVDYVIENGVTAVVTGGMLSVMSFNVWVDASTRASRQAAVVGMIQKYLPDTIGLQEASPEWMSALKSKLGSLYGFAGVGRNGGNSGEYSAVMYLKEKFTLKASDTKWLSATPDVKGSKFESSTLPRIMTYAVLERKSDKAVFVHVNTHLQHQSDPTPRNLQIAVLLEQIKPYLNYPIILTGDFNSKSSSDVYKTVINSGFEDISKIAEDSTQGPTFPSSSSIIDFIFISGKMTYAYSYKVCSEKIDNVAPSDHYPIFAKYYILN